jgi:methylenetetrahydrofolate reductase (NADPH)
VTGRLQQVLRRGDFALTAETTPPDAGTAAPVVERVACLRGLADAVNVTDGAGAKAHMSALAACAVLARNGIEPVLQMTLRDRNRMALQAELMGAGALDIPNILCLRGDDVTAGDQPEAKPVFDIDTLTLVRTARAMRDEGVLPSGRKVAPAPKLFIGVADTPIEPKPGWRPDGLLAKIGAGADFVQTQYCFDLRLLRRYLAVLADHGITERVFLLVGIGPIASGRSARWMNENLYGVRVPEPIVTRLEKAADPRVESIRICVELLQELAEIPGVAGAHLMAPRQEEAIAEAIDASGLLARRKAA